MRRVMITGGPGSGKSTMARNLGEATGLPVTHIDQIAWLPGWKERPREDTARLMHNIQKGESWIIDGQYSGSIEDRETRADTIIFLDYSVWRRLWRVLKRITKSHGVVRPDMADDCPEQFSWEFIQWIWNTHKRTRRVGLERIERNRNAKTCHIFRSDHEVAEYLASLT